MSDWLTCLSPLRAPRTTSSPGSARARRWVRRSLCRLFIGCFAIAAAAPAGAHPLSLQECFEGGDFIAHAAQARDNGVTKAAFNDKLTADIYLIQAFPRELRWFVVDSEDAEFLQIEASLVFDRPQAPESHRADFLSRCFDRQGAGVRASLSDPTFIQ